MKMTRFEREQWIMGDSTTRPVRPHDWLPLVSVWENEDGTLSLVLNAPLKPGQKLTLVPKSVTAPDLAPDYSLLVRRSLYDPEEGEVLADTSEASELL